MEYITTAKLRNLIDEFLLSTDTRYMKGLEVESTSVTRDGNLEVNLHDPRGTITTLVVRISHK